MGHTQSIKPWTRREEVEIRNELDKRDGLGRERGFRRIVSGWRTHRSFGTNIGRRMFSHRPKGDSLTNEGGDEFLLCQT